MTDLRAIAFYLPQFHPIAENDAWWGRGFTEWSNVTAAKPLFVGHHQPQLPAELGFYDLRLPETRAAQADLARAYGIHGFCYYRYWFEGRRLLERPFDEMLDSGIPDFPFCVCWANENWTRRWDGLEQDILLAQNHTLESDLAFLAELMPALRDPRYIRIDGKPLILIYRTHLLADAAATANAWRDLAAREGLPGLYLARVESLQDGGDLDPQTIGFDAAVEFPPNAMLPGPNIARHLAGLDPAFAGLVCDYETESASYMARAEPSYVRFSGVMPAWDNTARVGLRAAIRANATPDLFRNWLEHAASRTRARFTGDRRLIFINAWNEWGEGCHLEPDRRFGRGFLEAARAVLLGPAAPARIAELPKAETKAALEAAQDRVRILEAALNRKARELEESSRARDEALALSSQIHERLVQLERAVAERDTWIAERDSRIVEREARVAEREHEIVQRNDRIAELELKLSGAALTLKAHEAEIAEFRERLVEAEKPRLKTRALESALNAALIRASAAEAAAEHRASIIAALRSSTSWRITMPLRAIGRPIQQARAAFTDHVSTDALVLSPRAENDLSAAGTVRWLEGAAFPNAIAIRWLEISFTGAAGGLEIFLRTIELFSAEGRAPLRIEADLTPGAPPLLVRLPEPVWRARYAITTSAPIEDSIALTITLREPARAALALRAARLLARRPVAAARAVLRDGVKSSLAQALLGHRPINASELNYQRWIEAFDTLKESDIAAIGIHIARMAQKPLISVLVPVYNTSEPYLRAMIKSVRDQLYPHWELCIADDASTMPHVRRLLEQAAGEDARIKLVFRPENGHIAAASNSALALATGAFVALLDHDDVLAPHALYMVAAQIATDPGIDILYSDEDKIDAEGKRYDPYFKPDFNRELALGQNLVNHLAVYRTALIKEIGGFRDGFEGSQDYDLMLRAVEAAKGKIVHIPWILYHWRLFPGADTFSSRQKERAAHAAGRAVQESLMRQDILAIVSADGHSYVRVRRPDPDPWPTVSVIIPTRDRVNLLKVSAEGVLHQTDYPKIELIIADNESTAAETRAYLDELSRDPRVKLVACEGPFNFSRINNEAAAHAGGEILLLLNNDIEVIEPGWLKQMVRLAVLPDVGIVGAKLLYENRTLQHGGVVLGTGGVAGHFQLGIAGDDPGYFSWLSLPRDVSAVTGACLAVRRTLFEEVGGLDETNLAVAFNDIDFCLKVTERGYRIVWTPYAELIHHESKSRGSDVVADKIDRFKAEIAYMRRRWGHRLDNDPMFNPNLSLESNDPSLAFPPRRRKPWLHHMR